MSYPILEILRSPLQNAQRTLVTLKTSIPPKLSFPKTGPKIPTLSSMSSFSTNLVPPSLGLETSNNSSIDMIISRGNITNDSSIAGSRSTVPQGEGLELPSIEQLQAVFLSLKGVLFLMAVIMQTLGKEANPDCTYGVMWNDLQEHKISSKK
ncbi:hypothetical protein M9H77_07842 [Catharanthus roseus]|uniref:Uncharacterized protein n=1 Tax=Catharanthus roseus TaxID=4058 RepID=A0ACC0BWB8_CATRO|nr:hypothetical protein M9H77_07842 [Catharanthus roseus]